MRKCRSRNDKITYFVQSILHFHTETLCCAQSTIRRNQASINKHIQWDNWKAYKVFLLEESFEKIRYRKISKPTVFLRKCMLFQRHVLWNKATHFCRSATEKKNNARPSKEDIIVFSKQVNYNYYSQIPTGKKLYDG